MTDLTKLANEWSDPNTYIPNGCECAAELRAALPKWTRITDDEATWPIAGSRYFRMVDGCLTDCLAPKEGFTICPYWIIEWRPACGFDNPPPEEK